MFPRGNAGSTDTLFGGVGRTNKRRKELLKWNHVVNCRFIREMVCYRCLHTDVFDKRYSTQGPWHFYTGHTAQRPGRCIGDPWSGVGILAARVEFYEEIWLKVR